MCCRKRLRCFLFSVHALAMSLLLSVPVPALSADQLSGGGRVFAEAMARMMEAMGLLGDAADKPSLAPGAMPFAPGAMPFGAGQMPWGQMPWGQMPWGQTPWSDMPSGSMPEMQDWMQQMPGMAQLPAIPGWQRTSLDGVWEGRDGGLLIVQAHRFRLYAGQGDFIEGLIQQRGDRLALYDPEHDVARPYEFAQHQGRLVMRDPAGQVYLYRRLWLEDASRDDGLFRAPGGDRPALDGAGTGVSPR
jgi:hypothetical protein